MSSRKGSGPPPLSQDERRWAPARAPGFRTAFLRPLKPGNPSRGAAGVWACRCRSTRPRRRKPAPQPSQVTPGARLPGRPGQWVLPARAGLLGVAPIPWLSAFGGASRQSVGHHTSPGPLPRLRRGESALSPRAAWCPSLPSVAARGPARSPRGRNGLAGQRAARVPNAGRDAGPADWMAPVEPPGGSATEALLRPARLALAFGHSQGESHRSSGRP